MKKHWHCPNCESAAITYDDKIPMHPCRGLAGLMAPLVPAGQKAKQVAVEREDYVGKETVQVDGNGRPVMAVRTTKDDGEDCTIFAPVAGVGVEARK